MNNSKNSILLVDPEFDPNTASDCDLLVKVTADSLSYAVIDKNSRQLKAVFDQQECDDPATALATALKKDSYLRLPFREVKVSVFSANTLAVPNELFRKQQLGSYLSLFSDEPDTTIYSRPFEQYGLNQVFNLEPFVEETLDTYLAAATRYEQNAPVLALATALEGSSLSLDFTAGSFNALLLDNHQVIFQNSFQIEDPEEFNYYLLLLIQELQLEISCVNINVSGIIHENDGYYSCLAKYFSTITFNPPPASDIDQKILDDMPAHYYSSLLALDLCV